MSRSWSVLDFMLIWLGGVLGSGIFGAAGLALGNNDLQTLIVIGGQYAGNLIVFWLLARLKDDGDVGFAIQGGDFGYIAAGLTLQIALAVAFLPLSNLLFPDGRPSQNAADMIAGADTLLLRVGLIATAVVIAPATEELMFRGVLLRSLQPIGKRFAMIVSALIFSAVHLLGLDTAEMWRSAAVVLPPIFILGLILAWLTQRSGRLGPAIFLHSGWNLLAAFVLLLPSDFAERLG